MSIEKQQQVQPFTTIVFGDYQAKKYGDTIVVKGKDGSVQAMEMEEFKKFLQENTPNLKSQPEQDTFVSTKDAINSIMFPQYAPINKGDNLLEIWGKMSHNLIASEMNPFQFKGF